MVKGPSHFAPAAGCQRRRSRGPPTATLLPGWESPMPTPTPPSPLPPLRVLVVDDSPEARASLRQLLGIWGHPVCEAADADEALRLAPEFRPEVALVDVVMPGMDGLELASRLKEVPGLEGLAVVALTGQTDDEKIRRAYQVGVRHYLVKPADPVLLRGILGAIRYKDRP